MSPPHVNGTGDYLLPSLKKIFVEPNFSSSMAQVDVKSLFRICVVVSYYVRMLLSFSASGARPQLIAVHRHNVSF